MHQDDPTSVPPGTPSGQPPQQPSPSPVPPPSQPAYRPAGGGPSGPRATFGQRFLAALLDGVIGVVVYAILAAIFSDAGTALYYAFGVAYFTYLEGSPSGQTVGKRALNIRVLDFLTGGPAGYAKALGRYFARILSSIPLGLGYFWMLWDPEKRTWHDKLSNTVVVPVSAYPVERWPG